MKKTTSLKKDVYFSRENLDWLIKQANESNQSVSRTIDNMILEARLREEIQKENPSS